MSSICRTVTRCAWSKHDYDYSSLLCSVSYPSVLPASSDLPSHSLFLTLNPQPSTLNPKSHTLIPLPQVLCVYARHLTRPLLCLNPQSSTLDPKALILHPTPSSPYALNTAFKLAIHAEPVFGNRLEVHQIVLVSLYGSRSGKAAKQPDAQHRVQLPTLRPPSARCCPS